MSTLQFGYHEIVTTPQELTGQFRDRAQRHSADNRAFMLRVPILLYSSDGRIFLRDMKQASGNSANACVTLPFDEQDITKPNSTVKKIADAHVLHKMFSDMRDMGPDMIDTSPLGSYNSYASDIGTPTDILSIPALSRLWLTHDQVKVDFMYARLRGKPIWETVDSAVDLLQEQASVIAENKLATEALAVVRLLQREGTY